MLRYCKVSYPEILCVDEEFWVKIHSSKSEQEANLSMSPEESVILQTCEKSDGDNVGFPLFVNGRAGSGKSTILQYMFAFRFLRWAKFMRDDAPDSYPLYLASSRGLLDVARAAVTTILQLNYKQLNASPDDELLKVLENCFQQTSAFMHSLLNESDNQKFPLSNRVDYAEFRRRWSLRYGKEKKAVKTFGPQISWHVIRGLIKGLTEETYEREDFDEIPRDEKTISRETFELVHDRVGSAWYSNLHGAENAWDDQDLVRHLIKHKLLPQQHVALFCDEAQDFTRLELEAIYQCSIFSNRSISRQDAGKIPFVFVGDPFQTLNPTGFRWEAVQAAFSERIADALHRFDRKGATPKLHYEELLLNYRSAKRIVDFCNSIQLARAVFFDHKSLRPQTTWRIEENPSPPVFLDLGQDWLKQSFIDESNADLTFIVPCEEGEEIEYVENDPYLTAVVARDEDKVPRNVKSPAQAKGLEFNRVVLYGWSRRDEALKISTLLKTSSTNALSVDEKLPLEYFMNNLYVAASRAKRRLFILDSTSSLKGLWEFVYDEDLLQRTAERPGGSHWKDDIGLMVAGNAQSLEDNRASHYEMAIENQKIGLATRDFGTLKQAAQYFDLASKPVEANECRAQAFLLYDRYEDAGTCFEKAGKLEEAVDAWWQGTCYREIDEFARRNPAYVSLPRCQVASYLFDSKATNAQFLDLLENLQKTAEISSQVRSDLSTDAWSKALDSSIGKVLVKSLDQQTLEEVLTRVEPLLGIGAKISDEALAQICFQAGAFERVIELLGVESNRKEVVHAKAMIALSKEENGEELSSREVRSLANYFRHDRKFAEASNFFLRLHDANGVIDCFLEIFDDSTATKEHLGVVTANTTRALLEAGRWRDVTLLASEGELASSRSGQKSKIAKRVHRLISDNEILVKVLIPSLAESDLLVDARGDEKKLVYELISRCMQDKDCYKTISRTVMGAAIERCGLDIDALAYYEKWRDSNPLAREREYAEKRWLACKLRQAEREDDQNSDSAKAIGYREAVARLLDKRGWNENDIPIGYPEISDAGLLAKAPAVPKYEQPPKPHSKLNSIKLGELSIRYSRSRGWVNIESDEGLCARVIVAEKKIENSDVEFETSDDGYYCAEWKLGINWKDDGRVILSKPSQSVTLMKEGSLVLNA